MTSGICIANFPGKLKEYSSPWRSLDAQNLNTNSPMGYYQLETTELSHLAARDWPFG